MERNFALEFVRVSEAAAIASARLMGRGQKEEADFAAVTAMRKAFDKIDFHGVVRIGEGERDEAPMLYIGEEVGARKPGSTKLDLAIDPLEGTTICSKGQPNSLSVIAVAEEGKFLYAPDSYMQKIAVGPEASSAINLDAPVKENLKNIAKAKKCSIQDLTVVVLDRQRHEELIREIREAGSRIWLIGDGDVQAAIATAHPNTGVDAPNIPGGDLFGYAIAANETHLIVGAYGYDDYYTVSGGDYERMSGIAYIYALQDGSLIETLNNPVGYKYDDFDTISADQFAKALDISGDTLVVGSPGYDFTDAEYPGPTPDFPADLDYSLKDSGAIFIIKPASN